IMATQFSAYHPHKGQVLPQGRYVWTRQDASGLWFHILLLIDPTRDEFTTEAAWGRTGKLPGFTVLLQEELGMIYERPLLLRTSVLWAGGEPWEPWWALVLRPGEYAKRLGYKL